MDGTLRPAVVATVTPLAVTLKRATTSTPVSYRLGALPAALVIGERVMVSLVDGHLFLIGRWDVP